MAKLGPYLLLIIVTSMFCIGLFYAAFESFRYDLMAKGRLLLVILILVVVIAATAFYFMYFIGLPSIPGEQP